MRDPQRIDAVLAKVKELWEIVPDWRLAQLINNVAVHGFYTEDDKLVEALDVYIKQYKK